MKTIEFTNPQEMSEYIKEADYIITHGGVGTIIQALNLNKKIIAVPRLKQYKEHVNDHQLQVIENFDINGYIIGTNGIEDIESAIDRIKTFIPKRYESNNDKFIKKLEEIINI